ncbi:MAG: hemolysin III family protein [Clostridia bacterium]|nr:hemolysin III family protein [Clostridia bacterium]
MSIKNVTLPDYTKGEEALNSISHGIGVITGLISLIYFTLNVSDRNSLIGTVIFSLSVTVLYFISTAYHSVTNEKLKKIFRLIDHSTIYVLISGTIIAICFICLFDKIPAVTIAVAAVCTILSAVGIILTFIDHEKYKNVQLILYLLIGWGAALLAFPLFKYSENPMVVITPLFLGGISYTVGTVFYKLGKKRRYFHSIFHIFVLAGTALHLIAINAAL